jgi:hypothetical protein
MGFLASIKEKWKPAPIRLFHAAGMRSKMGKAGRD